MDRTPRPTRAEEAERTRIVKELSRVGFSLPGTIGVERTRCGKPGCRCKADPPVLHGPYHHWTRKIGGRTVGRYLNAEQIERYASWFDQARHLRDLLTELEALSLRVAERVEGWEPQQPPTGHARPRGGAKGGESPARRRSGK